MRRDLKIYLSGQAPDILREIAIVPSYKCDMGCKYCFAAQPRKDIKQDMKLEDFQKIVTWIKPQKARILFIGGEPTMYPNLPKMFDICIRNKIHFRFATNNLFDNHKLRNIRNCKWLQGTVINYNCRQHYTDTQYILFHNNLRWMKANKIPFYFYFNISNNDSIKDYDQLTEDAKKYNATIGLCITVPHSLKFQNEQKKILYIARIAAQHKVSCELTRPIPKCMFSKLQWKSLRSVMGKFYNFSSCDFGPIIVNPDMTVFPCNSLNVKAFRGPSIFSFMNLKEVFVHYKPQVEKLRRKPLDEKCITCKYRKNLVCQGGCLVNKVESE